MNTLNNDPRCVYRTRRELFAVLACYRQWMREGLTDVEISAAMRTVSRLIQSPAMSRLSS